MKPKYPARGKTIGIPEIKYIYYYQVFIIKMYLLLSILFTNENFRTHSNININNIAFICQQLGFWKSNTPIYSEYYRTVRNCPEVLNYSHLYVIHYVRNYSHLKNA